MDMSLQTVGSVIQIVLRQLFLAYLSISFSSKQFSRTFRQSVHYKNYEQFQIYTYIHNESKNVQLTINYAIHFRAKAKII